MTKLYEIEFAINDFISEHFSSPFLDVIMKIITTLGNGGWFFIALTAVLLIFKKTRRFGIAMAISLIISTLITNLTLKPLIARPRPFDLKAGLDIKIALPSDSSFPSGHTTVAFSAAFSLFFQNKKAGLPMLVLALFIAFSRLYFYVHFPTDILGGILVGLGAALLSKLLLPYAYKLGEKLSEAIKNIKASKQK